MEIGFWIPIDSGMLDSLNWNPEFKPQDSGFHKQNFYGFQNPDSLTWGVRMLHQSGLATFSSSCCQSKLCLVAVVKLPHRESGLNYGIFKKSPRPIFQLFKRSDEILHLSCLAEINSFVSYNFWELLKLKKGKY